MLKPVQLFQHSLALAPILFAAVVPSLLSAQVVIIDNAGPGFSTEGTGWTSQTSITGFVGSDSLRNQVGTGQDKAIWAPTIPTAGYYDVYAWWNGAFNYSPVAPYTINHAQGSVSVVLNQQLNKGRWNYLGRYPFNAGTGQSVTLADVGRPTGTSYVSADAVRFEFVAPSGTLNPPTVEIGGYLPCTSCSASILPGTLEDDPDTKYFLISDMPEKFGYPGSGPVTRTDGLLYSTNVLLPEYGPNYPPAPFNEQRVNGFTTIDDDFEIFIFNIAQPGDGSKPRRIVVYAENKGTNPVTIDPRQVIVTDGVIGNVHEMESNLGRRVQEQDWDPQSLTNLPPSITINPGEGQIVGLSKKFALIGSGTFRSQNLNCFGIVRGFVSGTDPNIVLYIVALDEVNTNVAPNISAIKTAAETLIASNIGAPELEDFQFDNLPPGCTLRRSSGVYPHKVFRSNVVFDLDTLPGGVTYQMGLDALRTPDCPAMRQSVDALLSPKWLVQESIGNYQVDHRVTFMVENTGSVARSFDLEFGKTNADIGLVYQLAITEALVSDATIDALPAQTSWAGPNQSAVFKSLLDEPLVLNPGEQRFVTMRFQILGNSSTPFQIRIPDQKGPTFDLLTQIPVNGSEGTPVLLQVQGSSSTLSTPTATVGGNPATVVQPNAATPWFNITYTPTAQDSGFLDLILQSTDGGISESTTFLKVISLDEKVSTGWAITSQPETMF